MTTSDTLKKKRPPWITAEHLTAAHAELKARAARRRAGDPSVKISAIQVARLLDIKPNAKHETRRRRVRELMKALFAEGVAVLSSNEGYFLPATDTDWSEAQRYARMNGLDQVVRSHELLNSQQRAEEAGQMSLGDVLDLETRVA